MKTRRILLAIISLVGIIFTASCGPDVRALHRQALQKQKDGHLMDAMALYKQALEIEPENLEINRDYQNMLMKGSRKTLIEEYGRKLDEKPHSAVFNYLYGRVVLPELRLKYFQKAVELDGGLYYPRKALARVLSEIGKYDESIIQYKWLINSGNSNVEDYIDYSKALHLKGDIKEEERILAAALTKFKDPLVLIQFATLYFSVEEYDKAKFYLTEALGVNPKLWKAYPLLVQISHAQKNFTEAAKLRDNVRYECKDAEILDDFVIHIQKFGDWAFVCREKFRGDVIYSAEFRVLKDKSSPGASTYYQLMDKGNKFEVVKPYKNPPEVGQTLVRVLQTKDYRDFLEAVLNDFKPIPK